MTTRLAKALEQLPADAIEQVADFAESLARRRAASVRDSENSGHLTLSWAGKAADAYPEHASGVDAAHAAAQLVRDAVDRAAKG